jgi:hypothetical protein
MSKGAGLEGVRGAHHTLQEEYAVVQFRRASWTRLKASSGPKYAPQHVSGS